MVTLPILWLWVFAALALAVLLPATIPHRKRSGYTASLCLALTVTVAVNCVAFKGAYLVFGSRFTISSDGYVATLELGRDGFAVTFVDSHDGAVALGDPPSGDVLLARSVIPWWRFLSWQDFASFKRWGAAFFLADEPDRPGAITRRHIVAFVFPRWLLILILLVSPTLYLRRRALPHRRRRLGLCLRCGYDLRSHNPDDKCPECGTPKPKPPAGSKLSTATETQGKPA